MAPLFQDQYPEIPLEFIHEVSFDGRPYARDSNLCENTQMSIDTSLVETLNRWGGNHGSLIRVCSDDLVYAVILLAGLWFLASILRSYPIHQSWKSFVKNLIIKGVIIFGIPAGIAIVISESISAIYVRQRPFIADPNVTLLVPHTADGGMPSHHIVFMVALVTSIFFYRKSFAMLLAALTLVTGIARVVAGIHYPSDILVGAILGVVIVYLYRWFVPARSLSFPQ
jgi:membrane-associated phospholipid phosphatase